MKSAYSPLTSFSRFREEITQSSSLQALADEVYYNKLDIVGICYPLDKGETSALDPITFKNVIQSHCPSLTEGKFRELFAIAPKNARGQILYRDLAFAIEPATSYVPSRSVSIFASVNTKSESVVQKASQLPYMDVRLQHLNPGYVNKETAEFLKYYKSKEGLVLETFKYNEAANEQNFLIEIASMIRLEWIHGGSTPTILFRQFNKGHNGMLTMYGLIVGVIYIKKYRSEFCELVDTVVKDPKLTSAERVYLFRKVSKDKDSISLEEFVEWIEKYGDKKFKPLINLNVKLTGSFGNAVESEETKTPLVIKRLVEEMRDYGAKHVQDAFTQFVSETMKEFAGKKESKRIEKPITLTNFQKFLSVLNMAVSIEDLHEVKNWVLENDLAERYVVLNGPDLNIEILVKSNKLWDAIVELYEIPTANSRPQLPDTTPLGLIQSIKHSILKKKLNSIHKMLNAYANNGYIKEKDFRHALKAEIPEMSPGNLSTLTDSLKLVLPPTPIFPFNQYNVSEIMDYLNQILL